MIRLFFSLSLVLLHSHSVSSDKCADVSNDCRIIAVKCLSPNRIEQKLMEVACPLTCGYCLDSKAETTTISSEKGIVPAKCMDEADDCADRANFCQRKFYKRMMSLQCAKTCKFCDPDEEYEEEEIVDSRETHLLNLKSKMGEEAVQKLESLKMVDNVINLMRNSTKTEGKPRKFSKNVVNVSSETTDQEECVDRAGDCERNQKLCTHKAYSALFRKICAKTCEYCGLSDSTSDVDFSGELF
ncbi:unnamed protein product [Caenorhabditis sp. 36 PRJEB53466]|nr:unnamed protein product [Caenorhabditis sp. 36 PRJEB53466]